MTMRAIKMAGTAAICLLVAMTGAEAASAATAAAPLNTSEAIDTNWPAYQLYRAGKYADAMTKGAAENSARGYALAAAAAIGDAAEHIPPCLPCVQRAEDYAKKAIAADPKQAEGYIFYAMALGLDSHIIGTMAALNKGYATLSKKQIDKALELAPNNGRALAVLGGWNLEVVRGAGSWIASMSYGASADKGIAAFEKGIAADPKDVVLHYQFALSLAGLDADEYHDRIVKQLTEAANGTPSSAYDALSQKRAAELLGLLKAGKEDAFEAKVKTYQGFPA
jgi:hypothetical protein